MEKCTSFTKMYLKVYVNSPKCTCFPENVRDNIKNVQHSFISASLLPVNFPRLYFGETIL